MSKGSSVGRLGTPPFHPLDSFWEVQEDIENSLLGTCLIRSYSYWEKHFNNMKPAIEV
jgi:hypothetical protein